MNPGGFIWGGLVWSDARLARWGGRPGKHAQVFELLTSRSKAPNVPAQRCPSCQVAVLDYSSA